MSLLDWRPNLGKTFDEALDGPRLARQLDLVKDLMSDGSKRTLKMIAQAVGGSEAGVSARLRELRATGKNINKRRIVGGLWEYWMEGENEC